MTISSATLSSIQKTGASAHKATAALQDAKKRTAGALAKALTNLASNNVEVHPADLEALNSIGKLATRMDAIEKELRSIYLDASKISKTGTVGPAPVAASEEAPKASVVTAKVKPLKGRGKAKSIKVKFAGNTAKLMSALEKVLNNTDFTGLKQTELSKESGIPLGSMTSSLKKLLALGKIATDSHGGYKIIGVVATPAVVSSSPVAAKKVGKTTAKKAVKKQVTQAAASIAPVVVATPEKAQVPAKKKSKKAVKKVAAPSASTVKPAASAPAKVDAQPKAKAKSSKPAAPAKATPPKADVTPTK